MINEYIVVHFPVYFGTMVASHCSAELATDVKIHDWQWNMSPQFVNKRYIIIYENMSWAVVEFVNSFITSFKSIFDITKTTVFKKLI